MEFFLYNHYSYLDPSFGFVIATPEYEYYSPSSDAYLGITLSNKDLMQYIDTREEYHIYSLEDIQRSPDLVNTNGYKFNFEFWPVKTRSYVSNPSLPGYEGGIYTSEALFKDSNPIGPIGIEFPMEFPITITSLTDELKIGEYSNKADNTSAFDTDSGNVLGIPAGLSYLGVSLENRNQRYELPIEGVGATWELELIPAYNSYPDMTISIRGEGVEIISEPNQVIDFIGFREGDKSITFRFKQIKENAKVYITHNANNVAEYVTIDAIRLNVISD